MAADVRPISMENLDDVVRVINESSSGMVIEHRLDTMEFLLLAQYWNFSYEHSLVRYVDGVAAAVIVIATDPEARDAYTYYWGALRTFWNHQIALPLFEECCRRLHDDGYAMLHGDAAPDRPARSYRAIHSHPQHSLRELIGDNFELPPADGRFDVRRVEFDVISHVDVPSDEPVYWCQRRSFLRRSSRWLQFVAAYADGVPQSYAVVFPRERRTELIDVRAREGCLPAGYELLRWLLHQNLSRPFVASAVLDATYAHRLFSSAGFRVTRERTTLFRDLRSTCRPPLHT